ncbi:hypothetical protein [Microcoleus sp. bin38.metabat.b11b12b14.051]|uniref:hypothetical protein n=1 Tax=Microcoleus sp. bin38.metabat.b11b12b14.051 TaxID=2742709 RepID=UPI0025E4F0B3|nr:hypothetical protein [Microcoleus sp. bin38.metabat.b11b12b14.051]
MVNKLLSKVTIAAGLSLSLLGVTAPSVFARVVRVAVINNSGKTMTAVYMSAPSKNTWGENELGGPIADREKADFEWNQGDYEGVDAGCIFDVRAEYSDGKFTELDAVNLCKEPALNFR